MIHSTASPLSSAPDGPSPSNVSMGCQAQIISWLHGLSQMRTDCRGSEGQENQRVEERASQHQRTTKANIAGWKEGNTQLHFTDSFGAHPGAHGGMGDRSHTHCSLRHCGEGRAFLQHQIALPTIQSTRSMNIQSSLPFTTASSRCRARTIWHHSFLLAMPDAS